MPAPLKIATWLAEQDDVKAVFHPALPSCPGHEFFQRHFSGSSGLFSFELKQKLTQAQLEAFFDHFQLFTMAYSWGGFESLILHNQPEEIAKGTSLPVACARTNDQTGDTHTRRRQRVPRPGDRR